MSAGFAIRELLLRSEAVTEITKKAFPVAVDKATLPYIVYRRKKMADVAVKSTDPHEYALYELLCCAKDMDVTVRLAEATRGALDGYSGEAGGLRISRISLVDAEDGCDNEAYMMRLDFQIRI